MNSLSEIITQDKTEVENEWTIIYYSIMIDEVLSFVYTKYIQEQIKRVYFNEYNRIIFKWLIEYYQLYKKAPGSNIQNIYSNRKGELEPNQATIIESYLDRYAEEYIYKHEINFDFIKKDVIPKFVTFQEAELLQKGLQIGLDNYNTQQIIEAIESFNNFSAEETEDFDTIIPCSSNIVKEYYNRGMDKGLFSLPGQIGKLIGPIYKGATYAVTGTEKSGKTFFMQELAYQAVLFNRLKVIDISLEMTKEDRQERIWSRIGNFTPDIFSSGEQLIPLFDCLNNQMGTCQVKKRKTNRLNLIKNVDFEVEFWERPEWKICTKCRNMKYGEEINIRQIPKEKRFIPAIWYKRKNIKLMNRFRVERSIKLLKHFNFTNYRQKTFARFSASFDDIYNYYKNYTKKAKFKPDVVIIDYPDIMRPISGQLLDRFNIDYNWKSCAQFAQEENIALIIADQTNKAARNQRSIKAGDTSEDKRKDAHINLRITLNKTEEEENLGLQRVGTLFKRKGKTINTEVMLLQNMAVGNPLLDSEFWPHKWLKYPIVKSKNDNFE